MSNKQKIALGVCLVIALGVIVALGAMNPKKVAVDFTKSEAATTGEIRIAAIVSNYPADANGCQIGPVDFLDQYKSAIDTVKAYYSEQSYQKVSLVVDVFGKYTIPCTNNNATDSAAALAAATADGMNASQYSSTWFFNAGGPPGPTTLNLAYPVWPTMAHEMGHRVFGYFAHEHGVVCSDNTVDRVPACIDSEYGNLFSIMGQGRGHFSAYLKNGMGWAPGLPLVTTSGDYTIEPVETPPAGGIKGFRFFIPLSKGGNAPQIQWFAEYRQPVGFDSAVPWAYDPSHTYGVLLYSTLNQTDLQQVLPYNWPELQKIALMPGEYYCNEYSKTLLQVLSADAAGARVRVTIGARCPTGPLPPPPTNSAHISINPATLSFAGTSGGNTPAAQTTTLTNSGTGSLSWTGSTDQAWCHITPTSGAVAAGGSAALTVTVDSPSNTGTFNCSLSINGNADNSPQIIHVTYTVTGANPSDTIAPTVSITYPVDGGKLSVRGSYTITANATDDQAVSKVEFYADGVIIKSSNKTTCTDTVAPYTCFWPFPNAPGKVYNLTAKAYDAAGNVGTSGVVSVTSQ